MALYLWGCGWLFPASLHIVGPNITLTPSQYQTGWTFDRLCLIPIVLINLGCSLTDTKQLGRVDRGLHGIHLTPGWSKSHWLAGRITASQSHNLTVAEALTGPHVSEVNYGIEARRGLWEMEHEMCPSSGRLMRYDRPWDWVEWRTYPLPHTPQPHTLHRGNLWSQLWVTKRR